MWRKIKWPCLCLLLLVTAACGWHLRGSADSLPPVSLEISKQSSLDFRFIKALEQQGLQSVGASQTPWHLKIQSISYQKKPVMLDNQGNVSKIQLQASIKFDFFHQEEPLLQNKEITTFKEYTFDETAVLAKEKEDSLNQDSAFQDLAIRTRSILNATLRKRSKQ